MFFVSNLPKFPLPLYFFLFWYLYHLLLYSECSILPTKIFTMEMASSQREKKERVRQIKNQIWHSVGFTRCRHFQFKAQFNVPATEGRRMWNRRVWDHWIYIRESRLIVVSTIIPFHHVILQYYWGWKQKKCVRTTPIKFNSQCHCSSRTIFQSSIMWRTCECNRKYKRKP